MSESQPDWRQFEIAVARFVSAIGPGAKVTHDVQIPDAHTGHPRQRDVWIEWSVCGHFPAKALISCKHWSSRLNEQDIDHFNGEFISSGAQIGIIYAKTGFNDRAIEKARVLGFHCCKLYVNEPADIPQMLSLGLAFHFRPTFQIKVHGNALSYAFVKWQEVLDLPFDGTTVLETFVGAFDTHQRTNAAERWKLAREGSVCNATVSLPNKPPLNVELFVTDRKYQAKVEYTRLDGSYNMTAGSYLGSETTPIVDTQSTHPGPGWDEIAEIPESQPKPSLAMFMQGDSRNWLVKFGETEFPAAPNDA